jgi:cysteine sulfinate desulfinase/cysteine desulfurase-like protein
LLEAWGQHQIPAAELIADAKSAAGHLKIYPRRAVSALLAKELQKLFPDKLRQLFVGYNCVPGAAAVAAAFEECAADVSSLDEQRAAVRKREEAVASEQQALQQLVVAVAGLAQQQPPAEGPAENETGREHRVHNKLS